MKSFFKSKTVWFNVFGVVAGLSGVLPPKVAAIAIPIANVGLRIITNQPITFSSDAK